MLLICFPRRLDIVAGGVGNPRALGDGAGHARRIARSAARRWPWNRDKTVAGSVSFLSGRRFGRRVSRLVVPLTRSRHRPAVLPDRHCRRGRTASRRWSKRSRSALDDNLSVAFAAGAMLWIGSLAAGSSPGCRARRWQGRACRRPSSRERAGRDRRVSGTNGLARRAPLSARSSARSSTLGLGWPGWALLLVTFVAASRHVASRAARARCCSASPKSAADAAAPATRSPTAASRRSRRSPRARRRIRMRPRLAFVAALAAGGQRYGRQRDRQGLGPLDVSRHHVEPRAARDVRARCRSRAPPPASSARSRSPRAGAALGLIAGVARSCSSPSPPPPARWSRARSARRSKDRVS